MSEDEGVEPLVNQEISLSTAGSYTEISGARTNGEPVLVKMGPRTLKLTL